MDPEPAPTQNTLTVPLAIVVAGLLIAGAVFFSRDGAPVSGARAAEKTAAAGAAAMPQAENARPAARPLDAQDHIRGNPDAPVVIVEYSDTECPFCKRFHSTLQQILSEYGKSGKVAWVYRHFPLAQLHSKAPKEAEALECAAELGGNGGFWSYADELFRTTPSNDGLSPAELPAIAERVGLRKTEFASCLASDRHAERVQQDYREAVAAGGTGTPWSIVFTRDGKKTFIEGAQPYAAVKQTIDLLLKQP